MSATFSPTTAVGAGKQNTWEYLKNIGVLDIPPSTSPFDPGYNRLSFVQRA
jgi:hypothetical protein